MAHLSQDNNMVEVFREGKDLHAATAANIYKKDISEVTRDERTKSKRANFGIIYGITVFGLAERLDIPRDEAKMLIDGYFATFPQVHDYMEKSKEVARQRGYVTTLFGRRRYLPDINSHNATVRGFASTASRQRESEARCCFRYTTNSTSPSILMRRKRWSASFLKRCRPPSPFLCLSSLIAVSDGTGLKPIKAISPARR